MKIDNLPELRAYCESEIAKLKTSINHYQTAINQQLGGVSTYEDIIRRIDGTPDPGSEAVPIPDPLEPSPASPVAADPEPDEYPVDSARNTPS